MNKSVFATTSSNVVSYMISLCHTFIVEMWRFTLEMMTKILSLSILVELEGGVKLPQNKDNLTPSESCPVLLLWSWAL